MSRTKRARRLFLWPGDERLGTVSRSRISGLTTIYLKDIDESDRDNMLVMTTEDAHVLLDTLHKLGFDRIGSR